MQLAVGQWHAKWQCHRYEPRHKKGARGKKERGKKERSRRRGTSVTGFDALKPAEAYQAEAMTKHIIHPVEFVQRAIRKLRRCRPRGRWLPGEVGELDVVGKCR